MTDEFVPSPSVDSYTIPMDVQIPLIDRSSDPHSSNTIVTPKSTTNDTNRPDSSPTVAKIISDHHQPTDPPSQNESKRATTSSKLFPLAQLKRLEFYQALISEFIGTFLLTLVCTATGLPVASKHVPGLHGALAAGFIVATLIVGFGHNSGAHINPAVTVSFLVANEIDIIRAVFYIGVQLLGAVMASCLLKSLTPPIAQANLGMTTITAGISLSQAFVIEFIITFILCYTVHAICDRHRDDIGGSKALAVGLAVTIGCLFGGPYTGASMNPARSFGPATVMNSWDNHWIYWLGPLTGSIVAALIYTRVLKKPPSGVVHSDSHSRLNIDRANYI